jgi:hypothetical protein
MQQQQMEEKQICHEISGLHPVMISGICLMKVAGRQDTYRT